jgi:hypothetical protein
MSTPGRYNVKSEKPRKAIWRDRKISLFRNQPTPRHYVEYIHTETCAIEGRENTQSSGFHVFPR